jgi:hypothetical protein
VKSKPPWNERSQTSSRKYDEWIAGVPGRPDVQPAVGDDERMDAACHPNVDRANPILRTVAKTDEAATRDLREIAEMGALRYRCRHAMTQGGVL